MLTDPELALAAAEAGAAVLRGRYGTPLTHFQKSPADFATEADYEAERTIMSLLRSARPDDAFLGEESGVHGDVAAARIWLVDPLCGTLNFAAQTPLAAVNVALRMDGRMVAAASADPFAAEVFWTDGEHAYLRAGGGDVKLRTSAGSRVVELNLDPPHPNGARYSAARMLADPEFTESFRARVLSTTLALAWVAAGRRAAYVTDGHLRDSVHFASGIGLCRAAGCTLTDLRGQPVHTGAGGLVAAADDRTHAALLAIIDRQFDRSRPAAQRQAAQ